MDEFEKFTPAEDAATIAELARLAIGRSKAWAQMYRDDVNRLAMALVKVEHALHRAEVTNWFAQDALAELRGTLLAVEDAVECHAEEAIEQARQLGKLADAAQGLRIVEGQA
jgi:hypothetical protein